MIKLSLEKYVCNIQSNDKVKDFEKPIVFYKYHKEDLSRFFLTFSIIDFFNRKITHLFSFTQKNKSIIESLQDNSRYKMRYAPHCTIEISKDIDFLMFLQEESYFVYVNYQDNVMCIYTMEDIVGSDVEFKTISSTFFKDETEKYFYLTALDKTNKLHVYRISNDLNNVEEIDVFSARSSPPHTVRKFKNCLLLSHEFTQAQYYLTKQDKVITDSELGSILTRIQMKIDATHPDLNKYEKKKILSKQIQKRHDIRCVPSKIMLLDLLTKEKVYYRASGSNSAHFEIDEKSNTIYVSSHNFFEGKNYVYMFQPAVLDKFEYVENRLIWKGSFVYEKGYRYTSHRIFYVEGKAYLCTFGKPNRLIFIEPETMQLLFYTDIGKDELSDNDDISTYLNARNEDESAGSEFIGFEVSQNGKSIFFLDDTYLYIYDVQKKSLSHQIKYDVQDVQDWDKYILIAPHITHLQ